MGLQKRNEKLTIYFIILLLMVILSTIFLNSFYWQTNGITKRKIAVGIIVFFCVIVVPFISIKVKGLYQLIRVAIRKVQMFFIRVIKNRKSIIIVFAFMILGIGLAYITTDLISRGVLQTEYNPKLFCTLVALFLLILMITVSWENAARRVETIFVIVALIMGVLCIEVTPSRVGVSWDDEVHYARTLEISNVLNGIMYVADVKNIDEYGINIYGYTGYDRETDIKYETELESLYASKELREHEFTKYGVRSVSYIPAAMGIIIARGLSFSYVNVFNMGRLVNLLCYIFLIYCAIKRIKHGKVLVATIGLIPTTIFMAASYSYDWWVTGFTILGFSYFFAELQEDATLKSKNIVIMVGAIVLGCMPKAIYFPILFPLLFLPKRKFKTTKQRALYYLFIVGGGLLLVASFMLPMLIKGAGTGDSRGGEAVNATEQIKYILNNPVTFAKTLFVFLKTYISVGNAGPMLQRFAYVGEGKFYGIICLMLPVVAFLDRGDSKGNYTVTRCAGIIGCAVAITLSSVALYISFTAVGASTVAGMQGRYLVPTIYPALYCLGQGGTTHKINKNVFACLPMLIIALTFIYNMFEFCVRYY